MSRFKSLVAGLFLALAQATPALAEESEFIDKHVEVRVLSIDFQGSQLASLVIRPCDEIIECETLYASSSAKTQWLDRGEAISYDEARRLDWQDALILLDKHRNALSVERL